MKNYLVTVLIVVALFNSAVGISQTNQPAWLQQKRVPNQPLFRIADPDYKLSPQTGMTRKHWKQAALYLLNGAFSYINTLDDPMQFPKQVGKSYPHRKEQVPTEKLEGLCRTLFIAAPLLKEDPELTINNIKVADYYRYQLSKLIDPSSPSFIKPRAKNGGANQVLVEFGALALSFFAAPDVLWQPLPQTQKDALAATMISYGDGPTVPSNWKFFNIFVLSFFKTQGYPINEKLLVEYLDKSLEHYRGSGWYNDAPAYDYYSMWAFQMYGPLWAKLIGEKYYPEHAAKFMANYQPVKDNYPYMFGRIGEMIMWGRSMPYRFASVIPHALVGLINDASANYGWMRRIASGSLLQFLTDPNFLEDNIPTLGFYGSFEPAVQPYSCRGSVFWMGKAFFALMLDENNPFWTAKENEGAWKTELAKGKVYNKFQDSSSILITDYPNIGAAEVRAWCHVKAIDAREPFRASENYNRLSYNSAFPWQADSVPGVVAMNYIIKNKKQEWEPLRLYTFKKFENETYYRNAVLETNPAIKLHLADIPLPNGILRVDKVRSSDTTEIRLGHYALPQLNKPIKNTQRKVDGYQLNTIDNGQYQLAMVPLMGWKETRSIATKGVHPQSEWSTVINSSDTKLPGEQEKVYITLLLWKKAGEKWRKDELVPVKKVSIDAGTIIVEMKNREKKLIKYEE
ncbi:DUF2264 domain-containing protein [Aridibaculum aurantiacum]|uniref:DUF2264 domain-containing protein n=1 Tax=Aridibaculum aurantiacum TaxID=2810307 RepID=UPI001A95F3A9|nr:DUF2264 domain-containing protein [Aridibaculum aurantiacum]